MAFLTLCISCKKKAPIIKPVPASPTNEERIVGKWKITHTAFDDNKNEKLDAAELKAEDPSLTNLVTFETNGLGTVEDLAWIDHATFNWKFLEDNIITVEIPKLDMVTSRIDSITNTDMVIMDRIDDPDKTWTVYKKQN